MLRAICILLTGLLMLQVVSPKTAFCLREGSRVIQCQSLWGASPPPVVNEIAETGCCNKSCKEKLPADTQKHQSSSANEKNCCISLHVEHEGMISLPYSDFDVPERVIVFESIEPFFAENGFLLNISTEKPLSLVSLRSVVLIL